MRSTRPAARWKNTRRVRLTEPAPTRTWDRVLTPRSRRPAGHPASTWSFPAPDGPRRGRASARLPQAGEPYDATELHRDLARRAAWASSMTLRSPRRFACRDRSNRPLVAPAVWDFAAAAPDQHAVGVLTTTPSSNSLPSTAIEQQRGIPFWAATDGSLVSPRSRAFSHALTPFPPTRDFLDSPPSARRPGYVYNPPATPSAASCATRSPPRSR